VSATLQQRFQAAMRRVAKLGIEECDLEFMRFIAEAREAYREVKLKLAAKRRKEAEDALVEEGDPDDLL
jgi:DNA-binding SARP family transcriptional activator